MSRLRRTASPLWIFSVARLISFCAYASWRLSFWLSTDLVEAVHFGLGKHLLADGTSAIQSYLKVLQVPFLQSRRIR